MVLLSVLHFYLDQFYKMPLWDSQKGVSELQLRPRNGVMWTHHGNGIGRITGSFGSVTREGWKRGGSTYPTTSELGKGLYSLLTSEVRQAVLG